MRLALGLLSVVAASLACSEFDPLDPARSDEEVEGTLEIFTRFNDESEKEALDRLFSLLLEEYPDLKVTNSVPIDPTNARLELAMRLGEGEPPDSFQAISGVDILSYVEDDRMAPLDDKLSVAFGDVFPPTVLRTVSQDDQLYAIPVNIERDNNLYYNIELLQEHQVEPPRTLAEFYSACDDLSEVGVTPLAVAAKGWVLALVAFETLMPAVNGGDYYMRFFTGQADPEDAELRELLTELKEVLSCSNVADAADGWDSAVDAVYSGDAAMVVMGDWAKGYFQGRSAGGNRRGVWEPDVDFGVVPGLGSEGYFTFNSVVFGLPVRAQHPRAAAAFLEVVASREGQEEFNILKGSVPARTDVSLDRFDGMVRRAAEDFAEASKKENRLLPGYASLTPLQFQVEVNPSLLVFAVGGERAAELDSDVSEDEVRVPAFEVDYLINKIAANYGLLGP